MKYQYPLTIEFIDNISSLLIILIVPVITLGLTALLYMTLMNRKATIGMFEKRETKALSIISWSIIITLCSIFLVFCYYSFIKLDYMSHFGGALLGILKSLLYFILSPFIFVFSIFTADSIKHDLLINGPVLLSDVKSWMHYKFGLNINEVTKSTILVLTKMITLLLFSTKIINVTNFLLFNMLKVSKKLAFLGAMLVFIGLMIFYTISHHEELSNIVKIMQDIFTAYTKGAMR